LVLNADLIEHIETTPDTVISLTNGQKSMVLESADEIIRKVIVFRRQIAAPRISDAKISAIDGGAFQR
jgi:flagellar protein FlbD